MAKSFFSTFIQGSSRKEVPEEKKRSEVTRLLKQLSDSIKGTSDFFKSLNANDKRIDDLAKKVEALQKLNIKLITPGKVLTPKEAEDYIRRAKELEKAIKKETGTVLGGKTLQELLFDFEKSTKKSTLRNKNIQEEINKTSRIIGESSEAHFKKNVESISQAGLSKDVGTVGLRAVSEELAFVVEGLGLDFTKLFGSLINRLGRKKGENLEDAISNFTDGIDLKDGIRGKSAGDKTTAKGRIVADKLNISQASVKNVNIKTAHIDKAIINNAIFKGEAKGRGTRRRSKKREEELREPAFGSLSPFNLDTPLEGEFLKTERLGGFTKSRVGETIDMEGFKALDAPILTIGRDPLEGEFLKTERLEGSTKSRVGETIDMESSKISSNLPAVLSKSIKDIFNSSNLLEDIPFKVSDTPDVIYGKGSFRRRNTTSLPETPEVINLPGTQASVHDFINPSLMNQPQTRAPSGGIPTILSGKGKPVKGGTFLPKGFDISRVVGTKEYYDKRSLATIPGEGVNTFERIRRRNTSQTPETPDVIPLHKVTASDENLPVLSNRQSMFDEILPTVLKEQTSSDEYLTQLIKDQVKFDKKSHKEVIDALEDIEKSSKSSFGKGGVLGKLFSGVKNALLSIASFLGAKSLMPSSGASKPSKPATAIKGAGALVGGSVLLDAVSQGKEGGAAGILQGAAGGALMGSLVGGLPGALIGTAVGATITSINQVMSEEDKEAIKKSINNTITNIFDTVFSSIDGTIGFFKENFNKEAINNKITNTFDTLFSSIDFAIDNSISKLKETKASIDDKVTNTFDTLFSSIDFAIDKLTDSETYINIGNSIKEFIIGIMENIEGGVADFILDKGGFLGEKVVETLGIRTSQQILEENEAKKPIPSASTGATPREAGEWPHVDAPINVVPIDAAKTRAKGGPVHAGGSFLVGERGAEIFSPNVGGEVIPINMNSGDSIGSLESEIAFAKSSHAFENPKQSNSNPSQIKQIVETIIKNTNTQQSESPSFRGRRSIDSSPIASTDIGLVMVVGGSV